jgi:hypothetical protein
VPGRSGVEVHEEASRDMNWVLIGMIVAVVVITVVYARRRGHVTDLGSVSHQWIAEHRFGSREDSRQ